MISLTITWDHRTVEIAQWLKELVALPKDPSSTSSSHGSSQFPVNPVPGDPIIHTDIHIAKTPYKMKILKKITWNCVLK